MAKMKIELQTADIERILLSGDPETVLSIKNYVIQEFTRAHLKAIINDDMFKRFLTAEKQECASILDKALKQYVGDRKTGTVTRATEWIPNAELKATVNKAVTDRISEIVKDVANVMNTELVAKVQEAFEKLQPQLDKVVKTRLEILTTEYVDGQVKEKMAKVIAKLS